VWQQRNRIGGSRSVRIVRFPRDLPPGTHAASPGVACILPGPPDCPVAPLSDRSVLGFRSVPLAVLPAVEWSVTADGGIIGGALRFREAP